MYKYALNGIFCTSAFIFSPGPGFVLVLWGCMYGNTIKQLRDLFPPSQSLPGQDKSHIQITI